MISTVTSTTVSIVTAAAFAVFFSLVAVVTLLALLIQKEILTASSDGPGRVLSRVLNIAIAPLMLAFLLILVIRIGEVLN